MTTCLFGPSVMQPRDFPRSSSGAFLTAETRVSDEHSKRVFIVKELWKRTRTPEITIYTIASEGMKDPSEDINPENDNSKQTGKLSERGNGSSHEQKQKQNAQNSNPPRKPKHQKHLLQ